MLQTTPPATHVHRQMFWQGLYLTHTSQLQALTANRCCQETSQLNALKWGPPPHLWEPDCAVDAGQVLQRVLEEHQAHRLLLGIVQGQDLLKGGLCVGGGGGGGGGGQSVQGTLQGS
jgi:hypothetical protein